MSNARIRVVYERIFIDYSRFGRFYERNYKKKASKFILIFQKSPLTKLGKWAFVISYRKILIFTVLRPHFKALEWFGIKTSILFPFIALPVSPAIAYP